MAILGDSDNEDLVSEINVTPLVDVMLVLLTVFIVTAPLLMNAVKVKLPQASAEVAITAPKTAHISVTDAGEVFFRSAAPGAGGVDHRVRAAQATP